MIRKLMHFIPEELLDRATFERFGAAGLRYFRPGVLVALDWIWENYPTKDKRAITVNTWATGGDKQWRGLRLPGCPEYKPHSGHSWGAAVDFNASGITAAEMRDWIVKQHAKAISAFVNAMNQPSISAAAGMHPILAIRRIEKDTPTWVHIDCLEHDGIGLLQVNP